MGSEWWILALRSSGLKLNVKSLKGKPLSKYTAAPRRKLKQRQEQTALREASAHRVLETPAAQDDRCAPIPTAGRRKWLCLRAKKPRDRPASAPSACRASPRCW